MIDMLATHVDYYGGRRLARRDQYNLVWFAVAAIVLFALGVTILLGAIAWCSAHGMAFGAVYKASTFTYSVGCFRP